MDKTYLTAVSAKSLAQQIAFAPAVFQATHCLLKFNILHEINNKTIGLTRSEIEAKTHISAYGVGVLLEMGQTAGILFLTEKKRYKLTKVGICLLMDPMTVANFTFMRDVCYQGFFKLDDAIEKGTPEGLKVFGNWPTIYEGLSELPEQVKESWFRFDHFYSDDSFDQALEIVFATKPKHLLDVGGNTGKWSMRCCAFDEDVTVSILDLPGQLKMAQQNIVAANLAQRINLVPTNVLAPELLFPKADAIWMSQFLDCFSSEQIVAILQHCAKNMDPQTNVFIMETFWDNQEYPAAAYSLTATSLYFTAMANGNSKMYGVNEFEALIEKAGLCIVQRHENIGISHTILQCQLA